MSQEKLSRRDLLKLLAASAGAAALSTIPTKWATPVVEIGALPAHAQGSATGTISGYVYLVVACVESPNQSSQVALAAVNGCSVPSSGTPIPGVNIAVMGYPNLNSTTGPDGYYVLNNVPAGTPCLLVSAITTAPNKVQSPSGSCPTLLPGGAICLNILIQCLSPK